MKNPPHAPENPGEVAPYLAYGAPSPPMSAYPPPPSPYAPPPYGQPVGYGPTDPYAANEGPAVARKRGAGHVLLVIFLVLVGLVVALGGLGFVGYRMFGNQLVVAADPHEVQVTLPTHLHGWTKMEGKAETQVIKRAIATVPDRYQPRGAVYGRAGEYAAVVIVEPRPLSLFEQKALLQQDAHAAKSLKITMRAVPAGPLGGLMQCGRSGDGGQTICSFADDGLYSTVVLFGQPKDYLATVHAVRAAIEHRLG